jgi:acyl carrier protein
VTREPLNGIVEVVVDALRQVAPPGVWVDADSRLGDLGVDSLGLLEVLVGVEAATGVELAEEAVRELSLDLLDGEDRTVREFTAAVVDKLR